MTLSHDPALSPSVNPEAKLRSHRSVTLQANWAPATARRMAPSPTKAEEPSVARSLRPKAWKVLVEAGSAARALTAAREAFSSPASLGTGANTGVAVVTMRSRYLAALGRSWAPGRSWRTRPAASLSVG